jgi:tRNA G18 (ribose-2'-O)-methylase SpoU
MYRDAIKDSKANFFNVRDEFKNMTVSELRMRYNASAYDYTVCALNVEGDLNVGMMIRTASLMGAREFIVFGRRRIDNRSMVGADNYIPLTKIDGLCSDGTLDISKFHAEMKHRNLRPIFVEHGGTPLQDMDWTVNESPLFGSELCLVFGNESTGIPAELLTDSRTVVSIPQTGILRSLNVAAAASMVMWDYVSKMHLK